MLTLRNYWLTIVFVGVAAVFLCWIVADSQAFQACIKESQQQAAQQQLEKGVPGFSIIVDRYKGCVGVFVHKNEGAITAFATFLIAIFTIVLTGVTGRQARLTQEALVGDKRAFVFAGGVFSEWENGAQPGLYNWRFRPVWQNSGDTPTKVLRTHSYCELRNAVLPLGFNFKYQTTQIARGLLGPKDKQTGGAAPQFPLAAITPQDIKDVQAGTKFLYLWGWARYRDVFPNTPEHITRFCWLLGANGDPFAFVPFGVAPQPGSLNFTNFQHPEGNCADDECDE